MVPAMACRAPRKVGQSKVEGRCRGCVGCKRWTRAQWLSRLLLEQVSQEKPPRMLTLTYRDESTFSENNVSLYVRSIRRRGDKLRFFGTSERGTKTGRLHHHMILWSDVDKETLTARWPHGFVGAASVRSVGGFSYVAKYAAKDAGVFGFRYSQGIGAEAAKHWQDEMKFRWLCGEYNLGKMPLPYASFIVMGRKRIIWLPENRYREVLRDLGVLGKEPFRIRDYESWGSQMRQRIEKEKNGQWRARLEDVLQYWTSMEMGIRELQQSASPYT